MHFLPSKRAHHKAPRVFSTKNPEQKDKRRQKLVPEKVTEDELDMQAEFEIPIDLAGETSPQENRSNDEEEMELNVDAANEQQEQVEQEEEVSRAKAKQTKQKAKQRKGGKQLPTKKTTVGRGWKHTLPLRSNRGRNPKYDSSDDSDTEDTRQQKTQDSNSVM